MKKCISDRNYILRYPEFACSDGAKRREKKAVRRMNRFYKTVTDEVIAYCGTVSAENPRVLYLLEAITDMDEDERENFTHLAPVTVTMTMILRNRPEPTRRKTAVHRWQNGFLMK
ncbi:MAG: hypothetical protein E7638_06795 [Ruminococcaceae bacterium]|nr:hypothetical protein [Oscillospiraceae bacterium]